MSSTVTCIQYESQNEINETRFSGEYHEYTMIDIKESLGKTLDVDEEGRSDERRGQRENYSLCKVSR
jgi:hypothetical protein